MSVNNDNVETSFYSGSPISVHDACDRLIRLIFFPSDCRLPKTIVTLFKMTNNNYHPEASIRCVECSQILTQSNKEDGLIFCIHNVSAHLLNIVQYNAYHGCVDCFIKGVAIGKQIYFSFSEQVEKLKNYEFYLKNYSHIPHRSIQGKKGLSPLLTLLQVPDQTPCDSMHLIYHGHAKTLLKL
ncbi:unnamed protein product [Rotaria sordida]|uniref:Uncharacterized protein n=1 Tax=Rotaria sordida TaxID=392033 RepID=A0A819VIJ2_9BILA|nr:unnamed protein product [Rotaria sordida]